MRLLVSEIMNLQNIRISSFSGICGRYSEGSCRLPERGLCGRVCRCPGQHDITRPGLLSAYAAFQPYPLGPEHPRPW
jgi:hypothetical protein